SNQVNGKIITRWIWKNFQTPSDRIFNTGYDGGCRCFGTAALFDIYLITITLIDTLEDMIVAVRHRRIIFIPLVKTAILFIGINLVFLKMDFRIDRHRFDSKNAG